MGKRNKYAKEAVSADRLRGLRESLEADTLEPPLGDREFSALVTSLAAEDAADALVALNAVASGKSQHKVLNKALYALAQRGVAVPEYKTRRAPIRIASEGPSTEGLEAAMCPPLTNASRVVFFPYVSGRSLYYVQVRFGEPLGLVSLSGSMVSRSTYRGMVKGLAGSTTEGRQDFVAVDQAFIDRKLWEVGTRLRAGQMGTSVDPEVRDTLVFPREAPPHPAEGVSWSDTPTVPVAELYETAMAIAPVLHTSLSEALQKRFEAIDGGSIVLAEGDKEARYVEAEADCARDLIASWGTRWARETLLDAALYWTRVDEPGIAATLLEIAMEPDEGVRQTRLERFITSVLATMRRKGSEKSSHPTPPSSDEPSQGGVIL